MFLWRPFRWGGSESTESPEKHQVLILNSSAPNYFILKEWSTGHQFWNPPPVIVQSWVGRCREVIVNSVLFSEMLKAGWSLRDGGPVDQIGTFFYWKMWGKLTGEGRTIIAFAEFLRLASPLLAGMGGYCLLLVPRRKKNRLRDSIVIHTRPGRTNSSWQMACELETSAGS